MFSEAIFISKYKGIGSTKQSQWSFLGLGRISFQTIQSQDPIFLLGLNDGPTTNNGIVLLSRLKAKFMTR